MRSGGRNIGGILTCVVVLAFPGQASAAEVLGDGGFENNGAPWAEAASYPGASFQHPGGPICPSCPLGVTAARTGSGWVNFGGSYNAQPGPAAINHSASVSQTVTIPVGTATLSFWLSKSTDYAGNSTFTARLDATTVYSTSITGSAPYTKVTVDVSAFADGGAHTLAFLYAGTGSASGDQFTEAYGLDDVSIDAQPPPPPPDDDADGTPNASDNCPALSNPGQENTDGDGEGDACDGDDDNDFVVDAGDACPLVAAPVASGGCPPPPEVTRALTLKYKRGAFRGALTPAGPCAAQETVTVFRKKRGKDPQIGSDRTDDRGAFLIGGRDKDGKYYATVAETNEPAQGICLAVRSKNLKLGS